MPKFPCPSPHAPVPMPQSSCPSLHVPIPMPQSSCPSPHAPVFMSQSPCPSLYAPVPMPQSSCPNPHAPVFMPQSPCPSLHAPIPMPQSSCPSPHSSCPSPHALVFMPQSPFFMPQSPCPSLHAPVFTLLFQTSLESDHIPAFWKSSNVIPVPKKPSLYALKDNCPVVLTSTPSTCMVLHWQLSCCSDIYPSTCMVLYWNRPVVLTSTPSTCMVLYWQSSCCSDTYPFSMHGAALTIVLLFWHLPLQHAWCCIDNRPVVLTSTPSTCMVLYWQSSCCSDTYPFNMHGAVLKSSCCSDIYPFNMHGAVLTIVLLFWHLPLQHAWCCIDNRPVVLLSTPSTCMVLHWQSSCCLAVYPFNMYGAVLTAHDHCPDVYPSKCIVLHGPASCCPVYPFSMHGAELTIALTATPFDMHGQTWYQYSGVTQTIMLDTCKTLHQHSGVAQKC